MEKFKVSDTDVQQSITEWCLFVFYCCVDSAHADDEETYRSTGGAMVFLPETLARISCSKIRTDKRCPSLFYWVRNYSGESCHNARCFHKAILRGVKNFKQTSFELHEASQPLINAQKRNVSQSRIKHIKTKHHYIRKMILYGWCKLVNTSTQPNTTDMATKILSTKAVAIFSKIVIGLQDAIDYSYSLDELLYN